MLDKDVLLLLFEKLGFVGLTFIVIYLFMSKAPTIFDLIHTNNKRKIEKINNALNDENLGDEIKYILIEELNKLYFGGITGVMVSQKKRKELVNISKKYDSNFDIKELYIFHDLYEYDSTTKEITLIRSKRRHLKKVKFEIGILIFIMTILLFLLIIFISFVSYEFLFLGILLGVFSLGTYVNLLQLNFIKKFDD